MEVAHLADQVIAAQEIGRRPDGIRRLLNANAYKLRDRSFLFCLFSSERIVALGFLMAPKACSLRIRFVQPNVQRHRRMR